MRRFLLAGLCLFLNCTGLLFAQNKTLGIGTSTPNPNAALHVESPTSNQGFIMPRLTTVQRNAMVSLLTIVDKGLMLYDTDLAAIFIWDGSAWKSSGQFTNDNPISNADGINVFTKGLGSAGRFTTDNTLSKMPTVWAQTNSDSALSAAIYGLNTGTGDVAGSFRINNAANKFSALYSETNGTGAAFFGSQIGLGRGGQFQITNATNSNAALRSYTSGTGNTGFFTIDNTANASAGIFSQTNGTGAAILGENTGTGSAGKFVVNNTNSPSPALWAETNSNQPLSAPIYGLNNGTGDVAASFRINNTANTFPALFAETNGTGRTATFRKTGTTGAQPAVFVESQGGHGIWTDHNGANGFAGIIQTINATNPNAALLTESIGTGPSVLALKSVDAVGGDALRAETNIGSGSAGSFAITNAANGYPVISSTTTGTGPAIRAENSGAANGFAATFDVTNPANQYPAIQVSSAGNGSGVRVMQPKGLGAGVDIFMQNTSSAASGIAVDQGGSGHGGSFIISNGLNSSVAVQAMTKGTGAALEASTSTGFTALMARHDGAMNANAALIEIANSVNNYPALQVNTAGTGFAVNARHTGTAGDAIYAEHAGAANGSAGNFRVSHAENSASALFAATNAPSGTAVGASNEANGLAFAIWGGGMKVSTHTLLADASITTRASAYLISGGLSYTVGFLMSEGEIVYFFNSTAGNVTVEKTSIPANSGKTFIFLGGALRAL